LVVFLSSLSLVAVVANIIARTISASWLSFWLKTLCGVLFIALGLVGVAGIDSAYPPPEAMAFLSLDVCVITGLAFGLLGDVALGLKDQITSAYNALLFAGIILFGIGHIVYIAGLMRTYSTPFPWIPLLICLVIALGFVVLDRVLHLNFGKFKWAVAAYAALVTMLPAMGFFTVATGVSPRHLTTGDLLGPGMAQPLAMAVAGVCFLISDLVLAWTYFGSKPNRGWQHGLCYIFYYAAQFGIASSLLLV
jgi:hypothetical protein